MRLRHEQRYQECSARGLKWVLEHLSPDGSYQGSTEFPAYYKTPFFLGSAGRTREGVEVVNFVRDTFLDREGDFSAGPHGKTTLEGYRDASYHYMNGWLAMGAQRLGCFDVSRRAIRYLASQQHPGLGGVWCDRQHRYMDVGTTACSTVAFLFCGDLESARLGGRFLLHVLNHQPKSERGYYLCADPQGRVIEQPGSNYVIDFQQRAQAYWYLGITIAALANLYLATGEQPYLDGALQGYKLVPQCAADRFQTLASCKIAWGAAVLCRATGDRQYLETVEAVATYLADVQKPDGTWALPGMQHPLPVTADLTAELSLWFLEYSRLVA